MSQERREQLARSGSADAQKWKVAAVKPVYDTMTVEVEKTKVGNISTYRWRNVDFKTDNTNIVPPSY